MIQLVSAKILGNIKGAFKAHMKITFEKKWVCLEDTEKINLLSDEASSMKKENNLNETQRMS